MTGRQQLAAVAMVAALVAGGAVAATRVLRTELAPVTIGSPAPEFRGLTLESRPRPRSLTDYRGQVVLLNVWATWCGPCRVEMPSIEALHRTYGPRGLKVVAVSVDDPGTEEQIRAFARELGLSFEILHDTTGSVQREYQTTGYPETFVIARDGIIRKKMIGASNWNSAGNRALIAQLLSERGG